MSNRELFLGYIEAYNAKDVDGMLACFDESCIFENISKGKPTIHIQGKAELETLAKKSAEAFATREQKVISLMEGPEKIAAEIDYHAVLRTQVAPNLQAGGKMVLRGVSVCEFSRGKIVRLTDYS